MSSRVSQVMSRSDPLVERRVGDVVSSVWRVGGDRGVGCLRQIDVHLPVLLKAVHLPTDGRRMFVYNECEDLYTPPIRGHLKPTERTSGVVWNGRPHEECPAGVEERWSRVLWCGSPLNHLKLVLPAIEENLSDSFTGDSQVSGTFKMCYVQVRSRAHIKLMHLDERLF